MNVFQPDGSNTGTSTLLTLPRKDLRSGGGHVTTTPSLPLFSTAVPTSSSFLLLQLPSNCSVDDFLSSISTTGSCDSQQNALRMNEPILDAATPSNTYFVASRRHDHLEATTSSSSSTPDGDDTVSCIVESKGCSFEVHRVETSNTLLIVPPVPLNNEDQQPSSATTQQQPTKNCATAGSDGSMNGGNINNNDIDKDRLPAEKRLKLVDTKRDNTSLVSTTRMIQHRPTHWIQQQQKIGGGGSGGSYFLELRRKRLRNVDLRAALPIYDPYIHNNNDALVSQIRPYMNNQIGRTIFDLATTLQVSQAEIRHGLHQIQAYALPKFPSSSDVSNGTNSNIDATNTSSCSFIPCYHYCTLADHIVRDCYAAIVTGLYTMNCDDYGGKGGITHLDTATFVNNIILDNPTLLQVNGDEAFPYLESVLHHCLQLLRKDTKEIEAPPNHFILDVSKVCYPRIRHHL
jgi:Sister chromatid cohesion protein Dcc1